MMADMYIAVGATDEYAGFVLCLLRFCFPSFFAVSLSSKAQ